MKLIAASILSLAILLPLQIPGQQKLREIDLKVRGIGSGTPYSKVIRTLGNPISRREETTPAAVSCSDADEIEIMLRYPGLTVTLIGDEKGRNLGVVRISVTEDRWAASGIRVGARERDIVRRFGEPNSRVRKSERTYFHYVTPGNLGNVILTLRHGRLAHIMMSETLC